MCLLFRARRLNSKKGDLKTFAIAFNIPNLFSNPPPPFHPKRSSSFSKPFPHTTHLTDRLWLFDNKGSVRVLRSWWQHCVRQTQRCSLSEVPRLAPLQWNTITSHARCFRRVASSWRKHVRCSIVLPAWVVDNAHYYRLLKGRAHTIFRNRNDKLAFSRGSQDFLYRTDEFSGLLFVARNFERTEIQE